MKELIKQIESIKGVKTVEPMDNKVVVTFEAEKHAVKCTNKEQCSFVQSKVGHADYYYDGICLNLNFASHAYEGWYVDNGFNVISFSQYLTDYNLKDEWEKYLIAEAEKRYPVGTKFYIAHYPTDKRTVKSHTIAEDTFIDVGEGLHINFDVIETGGKASVYADGQWAEIIPDEIELVEGEIYYEESARNNFNYIFRAKYHNKSNDTIEYFSLINNLKAFYIDEYVDIASRSIPATDKQKRKLIKAEVKNGYFHELR